MKTPSFDASDEVLADWAEMVIHAETNKSSEAAEEFLLANENWLSKAERTALLDAFDSTSNRWEYLTKQLRSGPPSSRMANIIADLIDYGAFASRAKLSTKENERSDQRETALWQRELVKAVLLRSFPDQTENQIQRKATKVAAILSNIKSTTLSKMLHSERDAPRRYLASLRFEVENGPTSSK